MALTTWRPPVKPPIGAATVDWGHPLAYAMKRVWLFNESAGPPRDLVIRVTPTTEGTPDWVPAGRSYVAGSSEIDWYNEAPSEMTNFHALSFGCRFRWTTSTGRMYAFGNGADTVQIADLQGAASSKIATLLRDAGGSPVTLTSANSFMDGQPHTAIVTITAADQDTLYVDGQVEATGSGQIFSATPFNTTAFGGLRRDASSNFMTVTLEAAWVWPLRTLTQADALMLHVEPYAFLRPIVRRRYFVPAASPTFALDDTGLTITPAPTRRVVPVW